ncbi:MAG: hypothetical protein SFW67_17270 [Myxococcaceae bacterium]|nr:hypothetical protein [Myxococcaceae bacterium]
MRSNLFWIDTNTSGRLATMARPRGGDWLEDELRLLQRKGIQIVVSLLTSDEVNELDLGQERAACAALGLRFISFPIPDRGVPTHDAEAAALIAKLARDVQSSLAVAIHCRMGIGRASMVAAGVLRALGVAGDAALARIAEARGLAVPDTEAQRQWVLRLGG